MEYLNSTQTPLKVGLVENDSRFRKRLSSELESISYVDNVYEWESAETFWRDANGRKLDILLLDINLPGMNGVQLAGELNQRNPQIRIIMVSSMDSDEMIFEALRNGALGYMLKSELSQLEPTLKAIQNGGAVMTPTIAFRVLHNFQETRPQPRHNLTPKESQILGLMVEGKTVDRAASFLDVSPSTIQGHVKNIYRKLNVHNRAELANQAHILGLVG